MSAWIPAKVLETSEYGTTLRLPPGHVGDGDSTVFLRVRRPRNIKHHRKYWGMLASVVDATDRWPSTEAMHRWIKWELGMYTPVAVRDGYTVLEWDSTDFASMDQRAFGEFYDRAIAAVVFETGIDPEGLNGGDND